MIMFAGEQYTYFDDPAAVAVLRDSVERWVDTPFRPHCAVPGRFGGVDCVRLVGELMAECGVIPPVNPDELPHYDLDWSAHNDNSPLEEWIEEFLDRIGLEHERIDGPVSEGKPGDVLVFSPGRSVYHLGVLLERGAFVHVLRKGWVTIDDTTRGRFGRYYKYSLRAIGGYDQ